MMRDSEKCRSELFSLFDYQSKALTCVLVVVITCVAPVELDGIALPVLFERANSSRKFCSAWCSWSVDALVFCFNDCAYQWRADVPAFDQRELKLHVRETGS